MGSYGLGCCCSRFEIGRSRRYTWWLLRSIVGRLRLVLERSSRTARTPFVRQHGISTTAIIGRIFVFWLLWVVVKFTEKVEFVGLGAPEI